MVDLKRLDGVQVLDAPSLQDDFYLNLVDWSSQNVLAVGLGTSVYLWSASNSKVSLNIDFQLFDSVVSTSNSKVVSASVLQFVVVCDALFFLR